MIHVNLLPPCPMHGHDYLLALESSAGWGGNFGPPRHTIACVGGCDRQVIRAPTIQAAIAEWDRLVA